MSEINLDQIYSLKQTTADLWRAIMYNATDTKRLYLDFEY